MVAPKGVRAKAKVRAKKARAKRADAMIGIERMAALACAEGQVAPTL